MNEMQKKEQKNELPGKLSLEKERLLYTHPILDVSEACD